MIAMPSRGKSSSTVGAEICETWRHGGRTPWWFLWENLLDLPTSSALHGRLSTSLLIANPSAASFNLFFSPFISFTSVNVQANLHALQLFSWDKDNHQPYKYNIWLLKKHEGYWIIGKWPSCFNLLITNFKGYTQPDNQPPLPYTNSSTAMPPKF